MAEEEVFENEFNRIAKWTADAIASSSPTDPIPGACNGSGNPASLGWLAERLELGPTTRLLDTGAGLGGPAAWLARHCGAYPLAIEPMTEAARGAHRLFGLPVAVAWSHRLPFRAASFDVVLALAVLSIVEDKDGYLEELRRVLRPGGSFGLLEYVSTADADADADSPTDSADADADPDSLTDSADAEPAHNEFDTLPALVGLLDAHGFAVADSTFADELAGPPDDWRASERRVAEAVAAAHPGAPALIEAEADRNRFGRLLAAGALRVRLIHAVLPADSGPLPAGRREEYPHGRP